MRGQGLGGEIRTTIHVILESAELANTETFTDMQPSGWPGLVNTTRFLIMRTRQGRARFNATQ